MEEKDDWTGGKEGDRHPFTEINLQDEFVTPITLVLNYIQKWLIYLNDDIESLSFGYLPVMVVNDCSDGFNHK